jgi:hypothetical protein
MANITNLKVGRTGNGMSFTYLDMDIATECGRQMSYEITHEYGAIASAGSVTPDVGVNETDVILPGAKAPFTFSFQEYTNLFFNATRATGPRQAGTKSFVAIKATNMDVTEYSFHVPSCKIITTTGKEQALFRSASEENSFIDLYKDYRTINAKQEFLLSHIFFVLDRNSTARYNLTCNVRVCPKNYIGESCDIFQSCSTNPCVHGTCQDKMSWQTNAKKTDYTCTCEDNYEGTNCDQIRHIYWLGSDHTTLAGLEKPWPLTDTESVIQRRHMYLTRHSEKSITVNITESYAASWFGWINNVNFANKNMRVNFQLKFLENNISSTDCAAGKNCGFKVFGTFPDNSWLDGCNLNQWCDVNFDFQTPAGGEECNNKCRLNEFPSNCPEAKGKRCQFATWHRSGYCHLNEQCDFGPSSNGIVTKIRG